MSSIRTVGEATGKPVRGEPTWGMATLYPHQGAWSEADYLALTTNRLIELADGCLEFPPMPSEWHELIADFLADQLKAFVRPRGLGKVLPAGIRLRTVPGKFRQPDVVFLRTERFHLRTPAHWESADLVVEVVSRDDPDRDWVDKRVEYAAAGVAEYWIVDPRDRSVTIFALDGEATRYREAGRFGDGQCAVGVLLAGFAIDVTALFAAV